MISLIYVSATEKEGTRIGMLCCVVAHILPVSGCLPAGFENANEDSSAVLPVFIPRYTDQCTSSGKFKRYDAAAKK